MTGKVTRPYCLGSFNLNPLLPMKALFLEMLGAFILLVGTAAAILILAIRAAS